MALVGLLIVAGAAGVLAHEAFLQFSVLKWAITVGGPLLVLLLLFSRVPGLWATAIMILVIPIAPFVSSVGKFEISVLFAMAALATITLMCEGALRAPSSQRLPALVVVTPLVAACFLVPTFRGNEVTHQLLYLALFVDVGWVCLRAASTYGQGRLVVACAFVSMAGLQGLAAVYEYVTGSRINLYGGAGTATYQAQSYFFDYGSNIRTTGTFFDPISLGNVLIMALPIALVLMLRRQEASVVRLLGLASAVLMGAGIVVSLSRASWIAAALEVVCIILFSRGRDRGRALIFAGVMAITVAATIQALYGPVITERFNSIFHPTSSTVITAKGDHLRQMQWAEAERLFEQNKVGGIGFGNLPERFDETIPGLNNTTDAQSVYLQYLAEGGLFGGAVLVLLGGAAIIDVRRGKGRDPLYAGLMAALAGVAVTWVTDYTVRYYAVAGCLAVLLGLVATSGTTVDDPALDDVRSAPRDQPAPPVVEDAPTLAPVGG